MNKNELRNTLYLCLWGFFCQAKGSLYKEVEEPHVAPESQVADPCVMVSLLNYYWASQCFCISSSNTISISAVPVKLEMPIMQKFPVVEKAIRAQVQKAGLANSEIMHSEMSNFEFSVSELLTKVNTSVHYVRIQSGTSF